MSSDPECEDDGDSEWYGARTKVVRLLELLFLEYKPEMGQRSSIMRSLCKNALMSGGRILLQALRVLGLLARRSVFDQVTMRVVQWPQAVWVAAGKWGGSVDNELFLWFDREGMLRYRVEGDEKGEVTEEVRAPMVALGARDEDWVWPPHPDRLHYPWKPLEQMTLDDFNNYLYRWFEEAVHYGVVRCAQCGKLLIDGDDLPDADTWDAILIEKELVGWLAVHFDCKKQLPKKLKGLHPFELEPNVPPLYDLAHVPMPTWPSETTPPTLTTEPLPTDFDS